MADAEREMRGLGETEQILLALANTPLQQPTHLCQVGQAVGITKLLWLPSARVRSLIPRAGD
jgi:hypothetical protein